MEEFLLVARNITQAQHMEAVLARGGLRAGVLRTPSALSESGCSHAVRLRAQTAAQALAEARFSEAGFARAALAVYESCLAGAMGARAA